MPKKNTGASSAPDTPHMEHRVVSMGFAINGHAPSKNYVVAPPETEISRSQIMPFLMGRDGKLYIDKTLVKEGVKGFRVEIFEVL